MMGEEMEGSADARRQFRVYTTLLEIVEERGYCVPDNVKYTSVRDFELELTKVERQVFYMDGDEDQKSALGIHCNFSKDKIDEHFINKFLELYKVKFDSVIFVAASKEKPGADTDKQVQQKIYEQSETRTEIFKDEDLLFNVLKHDLVPRHVILKEQEKAEILSYYKVKESQLPKILVSDPVARFLGLRKGQVVKIIRKSETAGLYTTYRVAV